MVNKKRFMAATFVVLLALTSSSVFVSCEKKTTVIRESATPAPAEPGIEIKVKGGGVDVEGKIPTETK